MSTFDTLALERRQMRVKLLLMDCDGVLTDGRITLIGADDEQKSFHTRDGHGLVLWHRAGLQSGIISGNRSNAVERRAQNLGITHVRQGSWNKTVDYEQVISAAGVEETEVAYIGDDVTDIPLMMRVGFAVAVADGVEETRGVAHYITQLPGGFGAVREITDMLLKAQGRWNDLMRRDTNERMGDKR